MKDNAIFLFFLSSFPLEVTFSAFGTVKSDSFPINLFVSLSLVCAFNLLNNRS